MIPHMTGDSMKVESKRSRLSCFACFWTPARLWAGVILFLTCSLTAVAYLPGLNGPFLLDDFHNLEPLGYSGSISSISEAKNFVFGNGSGPTGRPVAMASFLLDDWSWPSMPFNFKKNNLFLHLASGLLVFLCLSRLLPHLQRERSHNAASWVALFAAVIWLVHPINLSTVLYPVQRMAILATFFSLLALYFYLIGREPSGKSGLTRIALIFFALFSWVFAIFSKENAILVIVFVTFLEIYFFGRKWMPAKVSSVLKISFPLGLLIVLVFGIFHFSYDSRVFSGSDRLMSQFFVVGDYLLKIIFPVASSFNLVNGEFESLQNIGVLEIGIDIIFAAVFLFGIFAVFAFCILNKFWVPVVGISWFFIFHLLESTVVPLEIYFEHRNYLPSIGVALLLAWAFFFLIKSAALALSALTVYVAYLIFVLVILSFTWSNPNLLFLKWEMDEPKSTRAKVTYSSHLESMGFEDNALEHIERALNINPNSVDFMLRKLRLTCKVDDEEGFDNAKRVLVRPEKQYTVGVSFILKKMLKSSDNSEGVFCERLNGGLKIDNLFQMVTSSEGIPRRKNEAAQLYALISDYYAGRGNFALSYSALETATDFTPTVDLHLKSATMLASAGLYSQAKEQLALAEEVNNARVFVPNRTQDIRRLRQKIVQIEK